MYRTRYLVHMTLVACAGALTPIAEAQTIPSPSIPVTAPRETSESLRPPNPKWMPPAKRVVTLDLRNVTLRKALEEIGDQATLLYDARVVPAGGRVTIVGVRIPVLDALKIALRNTDIEIRVSANSQIVLAKRDSIESRGLRGAVRGRVVEAGTRSQGVTGARVSITGEERAVVTGNAGEYFLSIQNVQRRGYVISVRNFGYAPVDLSLKESDVKKLESGDTLHIDIALTATPTALSEVVTTGAGDRQRYQVGNTIATIDADSIIRNSSIQTVSDLLANRIPGLQVLQSSGQVGAPSRIRIRGTSSLTASNDPIILIDGVRLNNDYGPTRDKPTANDDFAVANATSRLDDIDPNTIESIEVLKGPAASTLFGSEAANGVVVIKTKRGRAGPTRWSISGDRGWSWYDANFPSLVNAIGHTATGFSCNASPVNRLKGVCPYFDSLVSANVLDVPERTPLAVGVRSAVTAGVSGGSDAVQYAFNLGYNDEMGTTKMPDVVAATIRRTRNGAPLSRDILRPNAGTRWTTSGNVSGSLGRKGDFTLSSSLSKRTTRRGPTDGMSDLLNMRAENDTLNIPLTWGQFYIERPEEVFHTVNSIAGSWRPASWLSANAQYGMDFALSDYKELARRDACRPWCDPNIPQLREGSLTAGRRTTSGNTAGFGLALSLPLARLGVSRTTVGGQYMRTNMRDVYASAFGLPEGQDGFGASTGLQTVGEERDERATAGTYLDHSLGVFDRLFLGTAIRRDLASAFGPNGIAPIFPKWSLSYLVSDEPAFPWREWMTLRVRAAYGVAGVQPNSTTRLRTYAIDRRFVDGAGTLIGYADIRGIGNHLVRPERSVEREGGFEIGLWNNRANLQYTRFNKYTRDALVSRPLAPSLGIASLSRDENVGDVRNAGTEVSIDAQFLQRPMITWGINLGYGSQTNELVRLGPGVNPYHLGATGGYIDSRLVEGYPLFGRWAYPVTSYSDANRNGIIEDNEVQVGDSLSYMGSPQPRYTLSFFNNVSLLRNRVSFNVGFQFSRGAVQVNDFLANNVSRLAVSQIEGGGTLREQAYAIATQAAVGRVQTWYGYIEEVDVLRMTSLSMSYVLPARMTRVLRASSGSFALYLTNLAIWTNYTGKDPETNGTSANGNRVVDRGQFPEPKGVTARFNLSF